MEKKKKEIKKDHKPIIETLINTTALTMTSLGTIALTNGLYKGYLLIIFGMALEFYKYWGRKNNYW